jgi:hypothetical protein
MAAFEAEILESYHPLGWDPKAPALLVESGVECAENGRLLRIYDLCYGTICQR